MKEKTFGHEPYTFDRVVRMMLGAIAIVAAAWLIYILRNVLLPFGVAAVIAYLLEPLVQFNRRMFRLRGRVAAVVITLFDIITLLGILSWIFVPTLIEETHHVGELIALYLSSEQSVPFIPQEVHLFIKENLNLDHLGSIFAGIDWMNVGSHIVSLVSSGIDILLSIVNWLLTFLYIIFIMVDYDRLGRGFRAMIPPTLRPRAYAIGRDIKESMNRYFRGQALVAFCVGILFAIGFSIIGLPMGVVLGLFVGVLNLVPYLQAVSIPVTAMLCLVYSADSTVSFWAIFGEAVIVYIVVQAIQDLYLTPRIMGKAMGLNPAIILLSLSIWGTLLGLLGMIIALPMTTLLLSYYERYVIKREKARREVREAISGPADVRD